jgi:mannose-6-phosphate isomerase-like protein (cupin superfamily)
MARASFLNMAESPEFTYFEVLEILEIAKGCVMRLFIDRSKLEDSIDRCWPECTYDGHPDSDILQVPPHGHEVSMAQS